LVSDLGVQLGDLVLDVVSGPRAYRREHPTMFKNGLDLGDEQVVYLEHLNRPESWLGQHCSRCRDRIDSVGLVSSTRSALLGGALGRHFSLVETGCNYRDRDVGTPRLRSLRSRLGPVLPKLSQPAK
jgi:hypothetical protein